MHSSCSKSYNIEYKVMVFFIIVFFIIVLTVHKYEESNVDFNLFLNCCKLGNYAMSLARPFHMCIPLTVIGRSLAYTIHTYQRVLLLICVVLQCP